MHSKQVDIEEMAGKTILQVFTDFSDEVLIAFTDGTFALIYGYAVDDETMVENGDFRLCNWSKLADALLSLGIVTQSQYDTYKAEVDYLSQKAVAARRAQYEMLKAEFGSA
jgi:hypothetical protein